MGRLDAMIEVEAQPSILALLVEEFSDAPRSGRADDNRASNSSPMTSPEEGQPISVDDQLATLSDRLDSGLPGPVPWRRLRAGSTSSRLVVPINFAGSWLLVPR
jgi:hypothetical protein